MPGRVHDGEAPARPGDVVAVVEKRRRGEGAAAEREPGATAVHRDGPSQLVRTAHVVGMDMRQQQARGLRARGRQAAAILGVERGGVELQDVAVAEQVLVGAGARHESRVGRQDHAQARSQLHAHPSCSVSRRSRARRTRARSLA